LVSSEKPLESVWDVISLDYGYFNLVGDRAATDQTFQDPLDPQHLRSGSALTVLAIAQTLQAKIVLSLWEQEPASEGSGMFLGEGVLWSPDAEVSINSPIDTWGAIAMTLEEPGHYGIKVWRETVDADDFEERFDVRIWLRPGH
jgi:hypothetical protein